MSENYEYINQVLAKPLDAAQKAACCRQDNTIIAAGAGSGKTQVLATRFAWLVMSCGVKVDEILALTFTKKAASEIYQRIYQILRTFATSPKTPPAEKQRAEEALKNFNKARIQTLDSYCSTVVRQAANKYGVRPDFTVDTLESMKSDALSFVIENKENAALLKFAQPGKLQNLAEDFFVKVIDSCSDVTCESDYFEKQLEKQKKEITEAWNFMIKRQLTLSASDKIRFADILGKGILSYAEICSLINDEINSFGNSVPELAAYANDFYGFPEADELLIEDFESALPKAEKMKEVFEKSKTIGSCKKKGVAYVKFLKPSGTFICNNVKQEPLSSILNPVIAYIENYETIRELCRLLDLFMVQTNAKKKKNGMLSFKDVGALALKILKEQKDIRNQEKAAIKKIMIDEFQDNNGANRDMLFLLAEKDDAFTELSADESAFYQELLKNLSQTKLFFVGDEKQSIYKFRGADVTVFNALENDLKRSSFLSNKSAEENLKLYMTNNYRIAKKPCSEEKYVELLAAFNTLFGSEAEKSLFDQCSGENGKVAYEAYYTKNATYADKEVCVPLVKENVPVHVSLFSKENIKQKNLPDGKSEEDFLSAEETVAYYTAQKIRALYDEGNKNAENGGTKYADFAILCKSRGDYDEIAKYLNYFNIPYSIDQQKKIFADGPINDIYNLLRLCVFPHDKKAFAAYLCSSFSGLCLQSVQLLLTVLPQNVPAGEETQNGGNALNVKYIAFGENPAKSEEIEKLFAGLCAPDGGADNASFSSGEWQKYCTARAVFEEYKNRALTESLTTIINELWYKTGYRYETLLSAKTNLATEQFDFLFELARACEDGGHDVAWFVEQLEEKKQQESFDFSRGSDDELGVKDISYPVERDDAVEIMTIHKSKGLEFKHVFVLGGMSQIQSDKSESYFCDEEFGLSVKLPGEANYFFNRQKADADRKAVAEFRRLLYVAITRSEIDVYIVDKITSKTFSNDSATGKIKQVFAKIVNNFYGIKDEMKPARNGEIYYEDGNPFDLEILEPLDESVRYGKAGADEKKETFAELRQNTAEKIELLKRSAPALVETVIAKQQRVSPSGFEKLHEGSSDSSAGSASDSGGADAGLVPFSSSYAIINQIIGGKKPQTGAAATGETLQNPAVPAEDSPYQPGDERSGERSFNHGTFGTLAHAYLEAAINAAARNNDDYKNPVLPFEVAAQLKKDLKDEEFETLCNVCKEMAQSFFTQTGGESQSLGMQALQSRRSGRFCEAEYAFKLYKDEFFVKGFIDLIFENDDGTFTIVDYKTDGDINPVLYYEQQAVYRLAAKDILGVDDFSRIKTKLFYLRYARIVDITEAVNEVKIDNAMMQKVLELQEENQH